MSVATFTTTLPDEALNWRPLSKEMRDAMDEIVRREMLAVALKRETETKRMLGLWVSGLEPILVWGDDGEILGLTGAAEVGFPVHIDVRAYQ